MDPISSAMLPVMLILLAAGIGLLASLFVKNIKIEKQPEAGGADVNVENSA